jgi:hypothetical protein
MITGMMARRIAEVSGATPYKHWRIYVTSNSGANDYVTAQEIEMRATVGGADQCSGGTVTASSHYSSTLPAGAFDGVLTYPPESALWASSDNTKPQWIAYEFASPVAIAEVAWMAADYSGGQNETPGTFDVQASDDGVGWTTIASFSGVTGWVVGGWKEFAW